MKRRKVLLIGWDAADWKIINPLLDSGKMPALEKLVSKGVIGNLATLDPPLSPMLWTSIATGKKADKHGILGFIEPDLMKGRIRPVNSTSRKARAIWNILHHHGLKSNVVGWWPSHPAEPINGVMVSNFFTKAHTPYGKEWPVTEGAVFPPEMAGILKEYRIHPAELTQQHILPFVPGASQVDQEKDHRLAALARITAEAASIHAIATWLMENTEWDFMAVYYDSIDHYGHAFMKYRPPRQEHISPEDFDLYKEVVDGGYIFHDMMLERLMDLAGDDTYIILISDHGFHSDHLRPSFIPKIPAGPAIEHRPYGILCISGPGILEDERVYGATLLDITPTILQIFEIPAGNDMDGKILTNIFKNPVKTSLIDSWDQVEGDFGTHPPEKTEETFTDMQAIKQLVELGYIEDPGEDQNKAIERAVREMKYNLSRVVASRKNFVKALQILEELLADNENEIRFLSDAVRYHIQLAQYSEAEQLLQRLEEADEKLKPYLNILKGTILSHQNKPHAAIKLFKEAEQGMNNLPGVQLELGRVYLMLQMYPEAYQVFSRVLETDDSNAQAWHGLGLSELRMGKYPEAADHLLTAIGLLYHFPPAHYHLGETLIRLGKYTEASHAFEVCLKMNPMFYKARRWLIKVYEQYLHQQEKALFHKQMLKEQMKGKITIVSGLPRSGTSLMMQILEAGGIEVLTDKVRLPDESNPRGYYEYEKVKKLPQDHSWLAEAEGKAIKIIAHLLRFLPPEFDYQILFMRRNMYEIIASQQKMLGRSQEKFPLSIAQSFERELERVDIWQKKEPNVRLMYVDYTELVSNSAETIGQINRFLNNQLMEEEAVKVIDPQLYRTKI